MGRVKQPPKKNYNFEDNWNCYEYTPFCKKRKLTKTKTSHSQKKYFVTKHSSVENKQFYLGTITIGSTDNIFPESYGVCKICFNECENELEPEPVILNCDDSFIIIKSTVDIHFLKGKHWFIYTYKRIGTIDTGCI